MRCRLNVLKSIDQVLLLRIKIHPELFWMFLAGKKRRKTAKLDVNLDWR